MCDAEHARARRADTAAEWAASAAANDGLGRRCARADMPDAAGGAISALVGQLLVSTAGLDECVVHPEG